jgi:hypothetical protein
LVCTPCASGTGKEKFTGIFQDGLVKGPLVFCNISGYSILM